MDFFREASIIEAIIFLEAAPLNKEELSKISKLDIEVVTRALKHIENSYKSEKHGIELHESANGWNFVTKPILWDSLKEHYMKRNSERLSKAAMETLSVIAYSQPITRNEIESIRGVSCDSMIRILREKELIRSTGKKDIPGKPTLYGTTSRFLEMFELKSIADLPKLEENDKRKFDNE